ncbi:DUF3592 domain-containing protein [Chitinophaga sp. NPDC101104]|uniref:DUF3592 domain-containing protein n=1 Tax=Chitinophaga sp. NPDC101104 TaxID=3390561 RepID=UPI003D00ECC5
MNKRFIWSFVIFFVLLAGFLVYVNVKENLLEQGIRDNRAFTTGTVTEIEERGHKRRDRVAFQYQFGGKAYAGVRWIHVPEPWKYTLPGRTVPVVVDAEAPENARFLIFPGDFEELDMPYPDSIRLRFPFP